MRIRITIDEELYCRLKARTPANKLSAFIADAVRAKLRPSPGQLEAGYRAAAREGWRRRLEDEWAATEARAWPE